MRRAAIAVLLLCGCFPIRVGSDCERRISDCLKNCPEQRRPEPPNNGSGTIQFGGSAYSDTDTRTSCEKSCESICNG
jgi:hypothetical protein